MGRRPATGSIVLRYGLHLFRRDTTIWQVYIKLNDEKPVRKSLKTDDQSEATQLAWQAYTEATERQIKGQPLRRVTFKRLVDDYLLSMGKKPARQYHADTIKRHFAPYFSTHVPDFSQVSDSDIVDYLQWRRQKSVDQGRTLTDKTLNRENIVLRQIIKHAVKRGYFSKDQAPVIESLKEQPNRRPNFRREEYATLHKTAKKRIGEVTKTDLKEQRRLLYDFIIFMANTGIRPSEAKHLRWRHVDFKDKLIKLDAAITKNKKPREVVGRDPAITRMRVIRKRQTAFLKPHGQSIKPSDFVFSLPNTAGSKVRLERVHTFKTSFRSLLKACGFEYDEHNERHSITSLRHTYATLRLDEGTSMDLLSLNMGTSVRMIENHYGHVRTADQRHELTKMRDKSA